MYEQVAENLPIIAILEERNSNLQPPTCRKQFAVNGVSGIAILLCRFVFCVALNPRASKVSEEYKARYRWRLLWEAFLIWIRPERLYGFGLHYAAGDSRRILRLRKLDRTHERAPC